MIEQPFVFYPKTKHFKAGITELKKRDQLDQFVTFKITEKINGMNIGFIFQNGKLTIQSRNQNITPNDQWYDTLMGMVVGVKQAASYYLQKYLPKAKMVIVYGELAGKKIQHNPLLCDLDYFFSIFAIKIVTDEHSWFCNPLHVRSIPSAFIFNVDLFYTSAITFDISDITGAQQQIDTLVKDITTNSKVGAFFKTKNRTGGVLF